MYLFSTVASSGVQGEGAYTGLEIGGFASPNANHFWGKCESFCPTDSQYFWITANQFRPIANHLLMDSQKDLFMNPHNFFVEVLCNKKQHCELIANDC